MRAVVYTDHGETMEDVPEPKPGPEDVLISVDYCGICGSDLHATNDLFVPGTTMGHEFAGTIVEVGGAVSTWRVGDRVTVNPNGGWCGRCALCAIGAFNMCAQIWPNAVGLAHPGGLAELAAVHQRMVRALPDSVTTRTGAWVEPLAVAVRTVRRSEIQVGDSAVVFGAGPIGLLVTSVLAAAGVDSITVVEPSDERRATALAQGASAVIDPRADDPVEYFADPATAPAFGFECTGVPAVTRTALQVLRPRGRLTVNGIAASPSLYQSGDLIFKEIDIRGSFIYLDEFEQAIQLLGSGRVDIDGLISGVVSVDQAGTAFEQMRTSTSAIKYLISATKTS